MWPRNLFQSNLPSQVQVGQDVSGEREDFFLGLMWSDGIISGFRPADRTQNTELNRTASAGPFLMLVRPGRPESLVVIYDGNDQSLLD